jgi:hypothetical protein
VALEKQLGTIIKQQLQPTAYTKPQTFEDIKRESKKREKMSESVLSEGEELKNYKIEVERLITRESEKYSNCEQARQHYVTVCNQLRNN